MKNVIIFFILITSFAFSQEITYHHPSQDLKIGETYYLFGDQIKFRAAPDVLSKELRILPIGTPLEVLEKTNVSLPYYGMVSNFYKVAYQKQVGYVLGTFMALEKQHSSTGDFYFAYKKYGDSYSLSTRYVNAKKELIQKDVVLETPDIAISLSGNKGVKGVTHIISIDYLAEACGVNGGGIYVFLQNNTLYKALHFSQVVDGGTFWLREEIIFPNDPRGIAGKLLYQKEMGDYKDEDSNWLEVTKVSRELEWKSGEIFPKINDPR